MIRREGLSMQTTHRQKQGRTSRKEGGIHLSHRFRFHRHVLPSGSSRPSLLLPPPKDRNFKPLKSCIYHYQMSGCWRFSLISKCFVEIQLKLCIAMCGVAPSQPALLCKKWFLLTNINLRYLKALHWIAFPLNFSEMITHISTHVSVFDGSHFETIQLNSSKNDPFTHTSLNTILHN
jgi:hypothetical protein